MDQLALGCPRLIEQGNAKGHYKGAATPKIDYLLLARRITLFKFMDLPVNKQQIPTNRDQSGT